MKSKLEDSGWWQIDFEGESLDDYLIDLSNSLGTPVGGRHKKKFIEILRPTPCEYAKANSLSKKYSLTAFPFHCDTAHWPIPCRYLILGCNEPGKCGRRTLLLDSKKISFTPKEKCLLKDAVFLIKNGRNSFYGSILHQNEIFIRFDLGCMIASNDEAKQALALMTNAIEVQEIVEIHWVKNKVIVIDNWRFLHGRSEPLQSCASRELRRVLVS